MREGQSVNMSLHWYLVHSPNACTGPVGARLKLRARNPGQVLVGVAGP